jgi:hypothetical protein
MNVFIWSKRILLHQRKHSIDISKAHFCVFTKWLLLIHTIEWWSFAWSQTCSETGFRIRKLISLFSLIFKESFIVFAWQAIRVHIFFRCNLWLFATTAFIPFINIRQCRSNSIWMRMTSPSWFLNLNIWNRRSTISFLALIILVLNHLSDQLTFRSIIETMPSMLRRISIFWFLVVYDSFIRNL